MRTALLVLAGGLGLLVACSAQYEVAWTVRLSPAVAARQGTVRVHVVAPNDTATAGRGHVVGQAAYNGTIQVCCTPSPTVEILAWLDEDNDQVWDATEPGARDPRGKFVLDKNTASTLLIR